MAIKARSVSDEMMIHILEGGRAGLPQVSLSKWVERYGQQIHLLSERGYIQHKGNGNFCLTAFGERLLKYRYPSLFERVQ